VKRRRPTSRKPAKAQHTNKPKRSVATKATREQRSHRYEAHARLRSSSPPTGVSFSPFLTWPKRPVRIVHRILRTTTNDFEFVNAQFAQFLGRDFPQSPIFPSHGPDLIGTRELAIIRGGIPFKTGEIYQGTYVIAFDSRRARQWAVA
jgi:hypothetical protein